MYKMIYVKQVCETIYGREIPERTWVRWKDKLTLPKHIRFCSQGEMEQLLTLANMRRTKPLSQLSLETVVLAKTEALKNLNREVLTPLIPSECLGKNLPQIIKECTGKTVSLKTLYRWGSTCNFRFSANTNYTRSEIEKWLSISYKF
ncbi:MAG: hypothetical protein KME46_35175 [Brasilonema angustatum HA4187-MV1]|jgi:hypothetical protein|nr:hypothetical protein [Brasilonema angustatum HA4187-MV1]